MMAFHRYFDQREAAGHVTWSVSFSDQGAPDVEPDPVGETVRAIAIDRPGRRARAELLSRRGDEEQPDLLVIDGDTFWARTGTEVLTNGGRPDFRHGGADVSGLLEPSYVPILFNLSVTGQEIVAGRHCARVTASTRHDLPNRDRYRLDPFGMIAGGDDDYVLAIDVASGLMLRATKFVDGDPAETHEWVELTLDASLPDALFAPLV